MTPQALGRVGVKVGGIYKKNGKTTVELFLFGVSDLNTVTLDVFKVLTPSEWGMMGSYL